MDISDWRKHLRSRPKFVQERKAGPALNILNGDSRPNRDEFDGAHRG
jgi:hypothetical protein